MPIDAMGSVNCPQANHHAECMKQAVQIAWPTFVPLVPISLMDGWATIAFVCSVKHNCALRIVALAYKIKNIRIVLLDHTKSILQLLAVLEAHRHQMKVVAIPYIVSIWHSETTRAIERGFAINRSPLWSSWRLTLLSALRLRTIKQKENHSNSRLIYRWNDDFFREKGKDNYSIFQTTC